MKLTLAPVRQKLSYEEQLFQVFLQTQQRAICVTNQQRSDFPSLLPGNPVTLVRGSLDPAAKGCTDDLKSWKSDRAHRGQPLADPVLVRAEECAGFH